MSVHRSFQLPGTKLHLRQWGDGPVACVLIHGFGDGGYVWEDFCVSLPTGYRALAVDLCGHGFSQWSTDGRYETARHITDVIHVLDSLGLDRLVLVGHSLGAEISARVASACPTRVAGLVLVDFGPDRNPAGMALVRSRLEESLRVYQSTGDYLQWLIATRPLASLQLLQQWVTSSLEGTREGGFRLRIDPTMVELRSETEGEDAALWAMLRCIEAPTLIVRGAGSAVLPRSVAEKMTLEMPNAILETIDEAGHAVMLDNPGAFRRVMGSFLSEIRQHV